MRTGWPQVVTARWIMEDRPKAPSAARSARRNRRRRSGRGWWSPEYRGRRRGRHRRRVGRKRHWGAGADDRSVCGHAAIILCQGLLHVRESTQRFRRARRSRRCREEEALPGVWMIERAERGGKTHLSAACHWDRRHSATLHLPRKLDGSAHRKRLCPIEIGLDLVMRLHARGHAETFRVGLEQRLSLAQRDSNHQRVSVM
jgi:hypothetical protein